MTKNSSSVKHSLSTDQGSRIRSLFASVVMAAIDDAIKDNKDGYDGTAQIRRWANSRDGKEVLTCAGIEPGNNVTSELEKIVGLGVPTFISFSNEESKRQTKQVELV